MEDFTREESDYYSKCSAIFKKLRLVSRMKSKSEDKFVKLVISEYYKCREKEDYYWRYFKKNI